MRIEIDMRGVEAAFKLAPALFLSEMSRGAKEGLTLIQRDARRVHRFKRRSGNLQRSVTVDFKSFDKPSKGVYLDTGLAPYANRIHEGFVGKTDSLGRKFNGPAPDRFLTESAMRNVSALVESINKGVARAIVRLGLKGK